jgi:hypothetical protein
MKSSIGDIQVPIDKNVVTLPFSPFFSRKKWCWIPPALAFRREQWICQKTFVRRTDLAYKSDCLLKNVVNA